MINLSRSDWKMVARYLLQHISMVMPSMRVVHTPPVVVTGRRYIKSLIHVVRGSGRSLVPREKVAAPWHVLWRMLFRLWFGTWQFSGTSGTDLPLPFVEL